MKNANDTQTSDTTASLLQPYRSEAFAEDLQGTDAAPSTGAAGSVTPYTVTLLCAAPLATALLGLIGALLGTVA